ncbi:MAG: hypothetical protein WCN92_00645 [Eubacteriales bacterium]
MDTILNKKSAYIKYQDTLSLLCLISALAFYCWKAPISFGFNDESAFIAYAHRLTMGDSLFTDEWHVAQLTGFLLYLPVKSYLLISGSTDGIVLFFRYMFVSLQGVVSCVIYWRLRKYGVLSILAAVIFYLHIPFFTIMSLGYSAMGLAFVALTGVLMATTKKSSKVTFYLTGLFFAGAVLCNPVLSFVYFLYSICMIICEISKNKKRPFFSFSEISFSIKTWFWITLGICTIAAIFLSFLFSKTSLSEIINNFPMLLTDPQYQFSSNGGGQNIFSIQKTLSEIVKINPYLFTAFSALTAAIIFDKKRIAHRPFYLSFVSVIFFAYVVSITLSFKFPYYGYWTFPLTLLGLICYILSENKRKDAFVFLWILGWLYEVCLDITSDMGFVVASQGLLVSCIASTIFIKNIIDELKKQNEFKKHKDFKFNHKSLLKVLAPALTAALLFQICQECYIAANTKFYPEYLVLDPKASFGVSIQRNSTEELNVMITNGPEKGLKTTASRAKIYNAMLIDLSTIKEKGDSNVLIAGNFPWGYLYLNRPYATLSAWLPDSVIIADKQRLTKYYELHPDKTPKYIYIPKINDLIYMMYTPENAKIILADLTKNHNYTIKESNYGYIVEIIN